MNKKKKAWTLLLLPILLIIFVGIITNFVGISTSSKEYSDIVKMINDGKIKEFSLDLSTGKFIYKTEDGKVEKTTIANPDYFHDDIGQKAIELGIKTKYTKSVSVFKIIEVSLLIVMTMFVVLAMNRVVKKTTGGTLNGFGKKKLNIQKNTNVKFSDVAGADEEKEDLREIVEFLKNPQKYSGAGARVPKGVLLVGPPGTGKTLLARAVAGEASVPFYSASGSDFVEMYVGVGASRVRELFSEAKKNAPSIVFIDEIDAVARQRGSGVGGGNDEREQTLNQILVEMDGFTKQNVVVIAATNRPEILDKAIMRPGRFDRQVYVNLPDMKGREEILRIHGKNKKFNDSLKPKDVAAQTVGFSGADLENLLNEAALLMVKRNKTEISQTEIDDAYLKVIMGNEKANRVIDSKDKLITAYHEVGHAIISHMLKDNEEISQISIIPRGMANGFTMYKPKKDKTHISKSSLTKQICSLLGGRAAEEVIFGEDKITAGASNDIERATKIASKMVKDYGMGSYGPIKCSNESGFGISEDTMRNIDENIKIIIEQQYKRAVGILKDEEVYKKLNEISKILVEKEKISGEEFLKYFS